MSDIVKALKQANYNVFQGLADRGLLQIKLATAQRMEKQLAALNQKYDGSKAAAIEDDINRLSERKFEVSTYMDRVESGLKRVNDVREKLIEMQTAIDNGSGDAFDLAITTLNSLLGRTGTNSTSLLANPTFGTGTWTEKTAVVAGGGFSAEVTTHFLGSDYTIRLDDGSGFMRFNDKNGALGSIPKGKIEVVSHDTATGAITVKNTETDETFSGTMLRGGLGMMNSWGYEGLSTPDGKAAAQEDLKAAIRVVAEAEKDWLKDLTQLTVIEKKVGGQLSELTDQYQRVSTEELNAKQAERRAIQTRFDIFNNSLALTQGNSTNLINQLFMTPRTYEKPSMTDLLMGAAGY